MEHPMKTKIVGVLMAEGKLELRQIAAKCGYPFVDGAFKTIVQELVSEGAIRQGKPTRFFRRDRDVWYEVAR